MNGNDIKQVADLYASGSIPPGSVGLVRIYHDEGCQRAEGVPCNCNPDIEYEGRTNPTPTDAKRHFKTRGRKR